MCMAYMGVVRKVWLGIVAGYGEVYRNQSGVV